MTNKRTLLITLLAAAGFVQAATAAPTSAGLYMIDTATGNTAFAAENFMGVADFNGTLGDYTVNIAATGTTIARGSTPEMELSVANATAGDGATSLQIYFTDGAFGPTTGTYSLATTGPGNGGPVTSSAYMGSTFFATTTTLASSVDTYPYTVNGTGPLNSGSYYLTLEDVISGSEVAVDSRLTTVPEPSTLFLGLTGFGVALMAYRRRN